MSKKTQSHEDLLARISELEGKIRDGEDAALTRVCKALKVDPEDVKTSEAKQGEPELLVRMHVRTPVRVNTKIYHGMVEVPHSTFMVIAQAIGDRTMRHIRELTGDIYHLKELTSGVFAPQLVGKIGADGERIA